MDWRVINEEEAIPLHELKGDHRGGDANVNVNVRTTYLLSAP